MNHRHRRVLPVLPILLLLAASAPALAVDGVIEINQAKATAGAVTPGDQIGFPVSITLPGSYRLTSDLSVSPGIGGMLVQADNVSLDLNGFNILGGGGLTADGISLAGQKNVEITNGTVRGFSRAGIHSNSATQFIRLIGVRTISNGFMGVELQGEGNLIDGCSSINNGTSGFRANEGSLVINSVARGNGTFALLSSSTTGYRSNVFTGNNGGDVNAQVAGGGQQLGTNICGSDLTCP